MTFNLNALDEDDFKAIDFLEHFSQMLLDGVVDEEHLLVGVPSSVRTLPEYNDIENLAQGITKATFTEADSIKISRNFLEILAKDPTFSPLLEKAWDSYRTDMGVEDDVKKTLSATTAAILIIFAATSEVTFQWGDWTIEKPPASPALIAAVPGIINSIVGKKTEEEEKRKKKR